MSFALQLLFGGISYLWETLASSLRFRQSSGRELSDTKTKRWIGSPTNSDPPSTPDNYIKEFWCDTKSRRVYTIDPNLELPAIEEVARPNLMLDFRRCSVHSTVCLWGDRAVGKQVGAEINLIESSSDILVDALNSNRDRFSFRLQLSGSSGHLRIPTDFCGVINIEATKSSMVLFSTPETEDTKAQLFVGRDRYEQGMVIDQLDLILDTSAFHLDFSSSVQPWWKDSTSYAVLDNWTPEELCSEILASPSNKLRFAGKQ